MPTTARATRCVRTLAALLLLAAPRAASAGGPCLGVFEPNLFPANGADWIVFALETFDDGRGPALYLGGGFFAVGDKLVRRVARWDGVTFEALGAGLSGGGVTSLAVFDDGTGPALFAAGTFSSAGAVSTRQIAKWDGAHWSALGSGLTGGQLNVSDLAVFDDGTGPALYVAGFFDHAGGVPARGVARWDGTSWSALGSGVGTGFDEWPTCLGVFDDGNGPALYVGGNFTSAGGVVARDIARWDGSNWSAVGPSINGAVSALEVFDDGRGPALYVGGNFTFAGGARVARWDGLAYEGVGGGTNGTVRSLLATDLGSGPVLVAGGEFDSPGAKIATWDGTAWSGVGSGVDEYVHALGAFDAGDGPALYAGGPFQRAGGVAANYVARHQGGAWSALSPGMGDTVLALRVHDDGSGPALVVGGEFLSAGEFQAAGIARFDGATFSTMGSGFTRGDGERARVQALGTFDSGAGEDLYAGGFFQSADGAPANGLARWNGSGWEDVGGGLTGSNPSVSSLAEFDDGSGPALFVGGNFTGAGGVSARDIVRWDGVAWSAVGGNSSPLSLYDLEVFDDGSGPALYACGQFSSIGGTAARLVARWDGTSWSAVGAPLSPSPAARVTVLEPFNDGTGMKLYAGGDFGQHMARWDGVSWQLLGGPTGSVYALAAHVDAIGPALYAGGTIPSAGVVPAKGIARWRFGSWSTLEAGLNGGVFALASFDDGVDSALYAGGLFDRSGTTATVHMARWSTTSNACRAGNVNGGVGPVADVLFLNGSPGIGRSRTAQVRPTDPVTISMERPPSRPSGTTRFALYYWESDGTPCDRTALPFDLGFACRSMPLSGGSADRIFNNVGKFPLLGTPTDPSSPAPSVVWSLPDGFQSSGLRFLQGIIVDSAAPNGLAAVTNAIRVDVR